MTRKEIEEEMRSTAMSIVNAFDLEFDDDGKKGFYAMLVGSFLRYFKAGTKWSLKNQVGQETKDNVDWEAFRREAAKDVLPAIIHKKSSMCSYGEFVKEAIAFADELIKQLKEEKK